MRKRITPPHSPMSSVIVRSAACAAALVSLTSVATSHRVSAQTAAPPRATASENHSIPVPSARAARRMGSIVLDGVVNDSAWAAATPITDFTQIDPDEGRPGSERTEFRILFDDDALYVGARLFDSQGAAGVRTRLVRRDEDFGSDNIEIVIDGFHDHLGRAFFDLNPSGSKSDFLGIGTSCCDSGWDPIWEAAT